MKLSNSSSLLHGFIERMVRLDPVVKVQQDIVAKNYDQDGALSLPTTSLEVLSRCFSIARPILLRSVLWRTIDALLTMGALFALRGLLEKEPSPFALVLAALSFVGANAITSCLDFFDNFRQRNISHVIRAHFLGLINSKLSHVDPVTYRGLSHGELKSLATSDSEAIEDFLSMVAQQVVPFFVVLFLFSPLFYLFGGYLGLIALLLSLVSLPLAYLGANVLAKVQTRAQGYLDEVMAKKGEWIRQIRLVRFLGWNKWIVEGIESSMRKYMRMHARRSGIACVIYGFSWSWHLISMVAVLLLQPYFSIRLTVGEMFSILWLLEHFGSVISPLPYSLSLYGFASASAGRMASLCALPDRDSVFMVEAPIGWSGTPCEILLDNVTVEFGDEYGVRELTLSLKLTERTAIIGEVASGKTLLLELLTGERVPTSGTIRVRSSHGQEGQLWTRETYNWFRSQIAYAPQHPYLSNATLRDNIDLIGTKTSLEIEKATHVSMLSQDIALFPRGLDEEIGEVGINLSGGQRQRVSIARALLSERSILILDDPLGAVDPDTEGRLAEILLRGQHGVVMTSHRMKELLRCDRVIVLENGTIVEDGIPQHLLSLSTSRFTAFYEATSPQEEEIVYD
jgi:ABC-type multidrug transport system fused ATPase/permease subunit